MKATCLLIIYLCLSALLQAQVSKTVDVTTAGSLKTMLTEIELANITDLTLIGTIDARDFKTMRDRMPKLEEIDLAQVNIAEYSGEEGTDGFFTTYSKDGIPPFAFDESEHVEIVRLKSIVLPPTTKFIGDRAFFRCNKLESFTMPPSIINIGADAFCECLSLTTISLPSTLESISYRTFDNCIGLTAIHCYGLNPPDFNCMARDCEYFYNVNKNECVLYVPYHRKEAYQSLEFKNIVEMPGFVLSDTIVFMAAPQGSTKTIELVGNIKWSAVSDQSWLTVSPTSGNGSQTITITAEANNTNAVRVAHVTFSAEGFDTKTILVKQEGLATGVSEMAQNSLIFNCYPNPFTRQVTVEIQNQKHLKLTVDIYNMAGQKVKNLAVGNTSKLLKLTWDGTNQQGQKVKPGIYICKMNEWVKQLALVNKF